MTGNADVFMEGPTMLIEEDCERTEVFRTRRRRLRNLALGGAVGAAYVLVVALTSTVAHLTIDLVSVLLP